MHHTGLVVSNCMWLGSFYERALGLRPVLRISREGSGIDQVIGYQGVRLKGLLMSSDEGHMLELLEYENPPVLDRPSSSRNVVGAVHLAFRVEDVDAAFKRVSEAGALVLNPPAQVGRNRRATYMQDPDGNWLELFEEVGEADD